MVDWMGTVLAQLLATTWFQALLALATLGSVVLAVVFYLRSKKEKQPRYAVSSYTLVEGLKAALF